MRQKLNIKLEKLFSRAVSNHLAGNLNEAEKIYNKIIKINSNIDVVQNVLVLSLIITKNRYLLKMMLLYKKAFL